MALAAATVTIAATAIRDSITHFQLHSAAPGASGTTSPLGTRVANTGTVSGSVITWSNIAFSTATSGLAANQTVTHVSYWSGPGTGSPATGAIFRGSSILSGDGTANAAGDYTVTTITETGSAS